MHSSLSELQSLVQMLHPTRIFPTVYRVPASLGGKRNTAHNYRLHDILASLAGVSEDISAVKKRAAYFQAKRARVDEWRAKIRRGDCIPMTQCVAEGRSLLTAPFDEM